MEKNGFRVTMTGGVDDTEYDRLNRNPLQEGTNLLIKEHAYLPNKFDLDVLKKRRAERDPKYTQLLTQRREELLGKDFIAPDYSKLTDDQMAAEVDKRTRSRINHETVYELKEFAGLNNVPDYEKRDFEGKEYLYNKPGAVVAYRFYKTYQGLKQLYTHMCQVTNNHKDWTTKLDFIEKEYAKQEEENGSESAEPEQV